MAQQSSNGLRPDLGIAAAAFACLLVTVSVPSPSDELQQAVGFFAICIPLIIAGAYLKELGDNTKDQSLIKAVFVLLRLVCNGIGEIGCGIGIYWVFRHVSPRAARLFLFTAVASFLVVTLLAGLARRSKRGDEKP